MQNSEKIRGKQSSTDAPSISTMYLQIKQCHLKSVYTEAYPTEHNRTYSLVNKLRIAAKISEVNAARLHVLTHQTVQIHMGRERKRK